jgi:hypothetical protein
MARPVNVGLRAKTLYSNTYQPIVQSHVEQLITTIDAQIQTCHNAGYDTADFVLPVTFDINGMSKKDAQILIYSELIMIYTMPEADGGKGFTNATIVNTAKPTFRVKWINGMNEEERKHRMQLIKDHTDYTKK